MLTSFSAAEVADFVFRLRDGRLDGYRPRRRRAPGAALVRATRRSSRPSRSPPRIASGSRSTSGRSTTSREMERLLDLGVDALMTDFPDRVAAVLRRRGLRPA